MSLKIFPGTLRTAAIVSALPVIPFMILETINARNLPPDFPIVLFALMWLMALSFVLVFASLLRGTAPESRTTAHTIGRVTKGALLLLIAFLWISIIRDQMPCFLGVPNCD